MTTWFMILAAAGWYVAVLLARRLVIVLRDAARYRDFTHSVCPGGVDRDAGDLATGDRQGRGVSTGVPARNFPVAKQEAVPARSAKPQH